MEPKYNDILSIKKYVNALRHENHELSLKVEELSQNAEKQAKVMDTKDREIALLKLEKQEMKTALFHKKPMSDEEKLQLRKDEKVARLEKKMKGLQEQIKQLSDEKNRLLTKYLKAKDEQ